MVLVKNFLKRMILKNQKTTNTWKNYPACKDSTSCKVNFRLWGRTYISNMLLPIVTYPDSRACISQQNFSVIFGFLVLYSCSSRMVFLIMVIGPSSVICYSQLWLFKILSKQSFYVICGFLVYFWCSALGIQIMVVINLIISNLLQPIVTSGAYFNRTSTWFPDSYFSTPVLLWASK